MNVHTRSRYQVHLQQDARNLRLCLALSIPSPLMTLVTNVVKAKKEVYVVAPQLEFFGRDAP